MDKVTSLNEAVEVTMKVNNYPYYMVEEIIKALEDGDYKKITKEKGARDYVETLGYKSVLNEIKRLNLKKDSMSSKNLVHSFDDALEVTMKKYGYDEQERETLISKILIGQFECITADNGARAYLQRMGIDEIRRVLKEKNIHVKDGYEIFEEVCNHLVHLERVDKESSKEILLCHLYDVYLGKVIKLRDGSVFGKNKLISLMLDASVLRSKIDKMDSSYEYNLKKDDYTESEAVFNVLYCVREKNVDNLLDAFSKNKILVLRIIENLIDLKYLKIVSIKQDKNELDEFIEKLNMGNNEKADLLVSVIIEDLDKLEKFSLDDIVTLKNIGTFHIIKYLLENAVVARKMYEFNNCEITEDELNLFAGSNDSTVKDVEKMVLYNNKLINRFLKNDIDGESIRTKMNYLTENDIVWLCFLYISAHKKINRDNIIKNKYRISLNNRLDRFEQNLKNLNFEEVPC